VDESLYDREAEDTMYGTVAHFRVKAGHRDELSTLYRSGTPNANPRLTAPFQATW